MDEQIKNEFAKSGFSFNQENEILQKCLSYCVNYKLSPADLVSHWEVYYLNRQLNSLVIDSSELDGFLAHVQTEVKESMIEEEPQLHVYSINDINMLVGDEGNDMPEVVPSTPTTLYDRPYLEQLSPGSNLGTSQRPSSTKASGKSANRMTPFGQRTNKFAAMFTFNENLVNGTRANNIDMENGEDDILRKVQSGDRCSLHVHQSQPETGCRFMYTTIEDMFNFLENRIKRHTAEYATSGHYGEPTIASMASQNTLFTVGMVYSEVEGRLNEKSVMLQGSLEQSGGNRVHLDLQKLEHFSLFPGQVIGVEGHNPSGHYFIPSKVIDSLPIVYDGSLPSPKRQATAQESLELSSPSKRVLSLVIAAGPFTTNDNLLFEPLTDLLAYASRKQPQLLVLMGPFVDSEHPEIKKGTVDRTFEDIFNAEIVRKLIDHAQYMGSAARIILVPSIRDAHHDYVFPQPPFGIHKPEDISHQISCLANPTIFSANEIKFGCCSVDILKHISSEEISRTSANASHGDRIGRLATHLLGQRSFYPLYPPSMTVPLDVTLSTNALEMSLIPDVLLLPSDLAPFVKVLTVNGSSDEKPLRCMCINPGRLAKGVSGGTFAEVNYNGDPDGTKASIIRI